MDPDRHRRACAQAAPAVAFLLLLTDLCFAQQAAPPHSEEVRIGVQLRWLNGDPVNHLSPSDFRVSLGAQTFPFSVARPASKKNTSASVPTRLLVIFSSPASRESSDPVSGALKKLKPVWHLGWQVSLLTPDGRLTSYASSENELRHFLNSAAAPKQSWANALQALQAFPGRRLVVYLGQGGSKPPDGLVKAARESAAMFYDVGGDLYQNYTFGEAEKGSTFPLPSYGEGLYGPNPAPAGAPTVVNNVETWSAPAQLSIGDVHNERTVGRAISDAIRDAGNYYELRLQIPVQTAWLVLGVSVAGPYRITAQAYTPGRNTAPGIILLRPGS